MVDVRDIHDSVSWDRPSLIVGPDVDRFAGYLGRWWCLVSLCATFCALFGPTTPFDLVGWVHGGIDFSDNPCWVARYNREIGHVLRHNTAGPNRAAPANGHARKNHNAASDPAIFTNVNLLSQLRTTSALAYRGIHWVRCGVERNIRAHKRAATNANETRIKKHGVIIDEHVFSELYVEAVVHLHRRLNPGIIVEQLIIHFWCSSGRWEW